MKERVFVVSLCLCARAFFTRLGHGSGGMFIKAYSKLGIACGNIVRLVDTARCRYHRLSIARRISRWYHKHDPDNERDRWCAERQTK